MIRLLMLLTLIVLGEPALSQARPQWTFVSSADGVDVYVDFTRVKRDKTVFSAPVTMKSETDLNAHWFSVDCRAWQFTSWQNERDDRSWQLIGFSSVAENIATKLCK